MPTVSVDREDSFEASGKQYSKDELDELCFTYGIELDDWLEAGEEGEDRATSKIDIPANRYDMSCFEGIARALNVYLGRVPSPKYKVVKPAKPLRLTVEPEVAQIRPYAAAAVSRGIKFTPRRYKSFIASQDKSHNNICRNRSLVAIGTHDLAKVSGDVRYRAIPPQDVKFTPSNQQKEMTGPEIFEHYTNVDKHMARYVALISDSPVVPSFVDAKNTVLSLPPLINSDFTKITSDTRDVFFDLTATDPTKLDIVLNEIVAMFAEYTEDPFTVEAVEVVYEGKSEQDAVMSPQLDVPYTMKAEVEYSNAVLGLDSKAADYQQLLAKMMLSAKIDDEGKILDLEIPKTRPDISHQCDIIEDAGIAYGFNSLPRMFPGSAGLVGTSSAINRVADILRTETAQAGWAEVMPSTSSSVEENFDWMRLKDDGSAVRLANPKTIEYQVVRTSSSPGISKTVRENRNHASPIKVFESGDVVFQDLQAERRARNERHFAAVYAGTSASFEIPHGSLDRLMKMLRYGFQAAERGYWLEEATESESPQYFPGRGARIVSKQGKDDKPQVIGSLGVSHPEVSHKFDLPFVCSAFEINSTVFL